LAVEAKKEQKMEPSPSRLVGLTERVPIVEKAFHFAREAHEGQTRKYTGAPYIVHPIRVARRVASVPHTREMVAAALLHDVDEDTPVTLAEIQREFGDHVARLVDGLTCRLTPDDGNRKARKRMERERLAQEGPAIGTIKVADVMDNSHDIALHDARYAQLVLPEHECLVRALEADGTLVKRAMEEIERQKSLLADLLKRFPELKAA
jgi:(p)ppGpp synthase/HD superfamily hydrolase